jgi:hypothetical protein
MPGLLVSRLEIAERLGISPITFDKLRRNGAMPKPLPGSQKYSWPVVLQYLGVPLMVAEIKEFYSEDTREFEKNSHNSPRRAKS